MTGAAGTCPARIVWTACEEEGAGPARAVKVTGRARRLVPLGVSGAGQGRAGGGDVLAPGLDVHQTRLSGDDARLDRRDSGAFDTPPEGRDTAAGDGESGFGGRAPGSATPTVYVLMMAWQK